MKRIKVVHIITRMVRGGAQENTLFTLKYLDRSKYEIFLITGPPLGGEGSLEEEIPEDVKVFRINELVRPINPLKDLMAFLKLYFYLQKNNFTIVHTHTSKAGILGRWAARVAGIPFIIHTPHGHVFYGYSNPLMTKIYIWLERVTSRITSRIIALTERGKEEYIQQGIGDNLKIQVIPSGVPLEKFLSPRDKIRDRLKLGLPTDAFIIGNVGRMVPVKGQVYFIRAVPQILKEFPQTHFLLMGEGELKETLKKEVKKLKVENCFHFIPPQEEVLPVFSSLDLFVLPSLNEGMGRVIVQAMAMGKPVVATRVGGVPDLITDGVNGFLVPPKDEHSLAQAIIKILRNPSLRLEMGKRGKERAQEFSLENMIKKIENLYQEVIKKGV